MKRYANLIPAYRLEARTRRRLARRWGGACAVMAGVVVFATGWLQSVSPGDREAAAKQVRQIEQQLESLAARRDHLEEAVSAAERIDAANKAMRRQPDWSQLLVLLGGLMDEDLALRSCKLAPRDRVGGLGGRATMQRVLEGGEGGDATQAGVFELNMEGYARTQSSVSTFLLRLEGTGLFSRVELEQMRKEPLGNRRLHAFEVCCRFGQAQVAEVQP